MKITLILKTVGFLQILLGVILIPMLILSVDTIAESVSPETMLFVRGIVDFVAASNIGIGFLLIVACSIRDHQSARKVLLGELGLMSCLLIVAVFNTLNSGIIVDSGQPSPFWILLIANPVLCIHGLLKEKQWTSSYQLQHF
tara:strand:+ start:408 stop:833 length:426 start_codon:yes stop_codon:yes gene_type:complete